MKWIFSALLGLGACTDLSGQSALRRGMTETEVAERMPVPDRIVMRTCGAATPHPFPCKVFVYEGGLQNGRYAASQSIVFEDVQGQWVARQWL
jgi:hypothetical protein